MTWYSQEARRGANEQVGMLSYRSYVVNPPKGVKILEMYKVEQRVIIIAQEYRQGRVRKCCAPDVA